MPKRPRSAPQPTLQPSHNAPRHAGQTRPIAPELSMTVMPTAPMFEVIVRRFGMESATIRPRRAVDPRRHRAALADDPLDLIVKSLWMVVSTAHVAPHPQGERGLAQRDIADDPVYWLDTLISVQQEALFPYPTSPRWDSAGGGRRIAEDGSPGLPNSWLKWLLSSASGAASGSASGGPAGAGGAGGADERQVDMGAQLCALAVGRVSRRHPELWRVYREYVALDERTRSVAEAARRLHIAPTRARRAVAQTRAAISTELAYLSGLIDRHDLAATAATLQQLYASLRA